MTELYGAYPSQFKTVDVGVFGLVDQRAVAEGNGYLFFVDRDGVKQYTGGIPKPMSDELDEIYNDSALISDGRRFYLFNDNGTNKKVYTFDLRTQTWLPEDDLDVVAFTTIERTVYALDSTGKIWQFNSGSYNDIEWEFTTKEFDMNSFFKKSVKKIKLKAEMEEASTIEVYLSSNGGEFKRIKNYNHYDDDDYKEIYCNIKTGRLSRFQIKIKGVGKSIVSGMAEYSFRSDKQKKNDYYTTN